MSARRSRIKGIANIPQRRKVNEDQETKAKQNEADVKTESKNDNKESCSEPNKNQETKPKQTEADVKIESKNDNNESCSEPNKNQETKLKQNEAHVKPESKNNDNESCLKPNNEEIQIETKIVDPPKSNKIQIQSIIEIKSKTSLDKSKDVIVEEIDNTLQNSNISTDLKLDNSKIALHKETFNEVLLSPKPRTIKSDAIEKPSDLHIEKEVLDITNSPNTFQKPVTFITNNVHSDSEYPLPPPSPNKASRSRIKAIPRLAQRKTSFSASESEDEGKRINRIRNDSAYSAISQVADLVQEGTLPLQKKKEPTATATVQKKIGRSGQTRKVAEARREFMRRFGANKPEKHKLTMMDLIFYNPDTNPMTNEENEIVDDAKPIESTDGPEVEENVDNPAPAEQNEKSDEENAMPVPQIKIGPSGEIILDEKSVFIERKDVEKQRVEMEKLGVVDADKIKTGYGIYKRHQRSKYWTHSETLKFYKALNTIGTDFMLMCELFPNRGRRELKIKFKKEEKINRHLIDKALMQPCNFDFEDLKHEFEVEERESQELQKLKELEKQQKEESAKKRQEKVVERTRKRKAKEISRKPNPINTENTEEPTNTDNPKPRKVKSKKSRKDKLSIKNFMSDSDADESDLLTQSESDDDVILSRKPTRYGRLPKNIQRYEDEQTSLNLLMKQNKLPDDKQLENVEPGSIMIITEKGPNGEPVYKIYMVTPEQKATRLDLSSDMATKALELKKGSAESIMTISANVTDDEGIKENNITIPADKTVTTLKSNSKVNGNESERDQESEGIISHDESIILNDFEYNTNIVEK